MLLPALLTLAAPAAFDLYLGTYGKGIYRARLDAATGKLSPPTLAAEAVAPSYLALHPNGRFLYAVHETGQGAASGYAIGKDGSLRRVNGQDGLGDGPCHLSVDPKGGHLYVAAYGDGTVSTLSIARDGALGPAQRVQNRGTGPDKARQAGPHMHFIQTDAAGRHAYACDLGTDEILVYPLRDGALGEPDRTKAPPGAGPRHLAFGKDGRFAYMNGELDNSVTAYAVDETGPLTAIQTTTSLPEGYAGTSHSAEIAVHPNGRWLYVSNRGHDSLAVFGIGKDGTLTLVEIVDANVREPRGFAIDPTGRWLVAAGQKSDDLAALPLDPDTGRLGPAASKVPVAKPVSVLFRR